MFKFAYNILKISKLSFILIKLSLIRDKKKRGIKLTSSLQKLGPSFIKLGQILSVRPDLVGGEIANALTKLQDKLPPFSFAITKTTIEKELGDKINNLFSFFDEEPIAAASIAQVHKATTIEGENVAVKILRPKITKQFAKDISLFYFIAKILNKFKSCQRLKPICVVELFENIVLKELDLRLEAAAASELKNNCKNDPGFYVPKVYWSYTSRKILTTEWINGININDTKKLKKFGHDLEKTAHYLCLSFLNQTYRDGFFHADLHPGNLFVNEKGQIVPIDFGIMGRIDKKTKTFVAQILYGFIIRDYEYVAKIHFDAGYVPKNKSFGDFSLALRAIGEPIMGQTVENISIGKLLALLFKVTKDFEMETQTQLLLLQKTMVLVEGVAFNLYPKINLWQQAEPWITDWAKKNLSFEAQAKDYLSDILDKIITLPQNIDKVNKLIDIIISEKNKN